MTKATLTPFDGKDVLGTGVAVRNAGDGLSKEMKIQPRELHHAEEVTIAIRCTVDKVRFDPVPDTEGLLRVHVLKAGTATIIPDKLVADYLTASEKRIEEATGVQRLPFDGKADTAKKAAAKKAAPAKKAAAKKGGTVTDIGKAKGKS